MYKIILADKTELTDLELNGNNYISKERIEASVFENNLDEVAIISDDRTENYTNMKLIQVLNDVNGSETWFILAEKTPQEIKEEKLLEEINSQAELISDIIGGVFSA